MIKFLRHNPAALREKDRISVFLALVNSSMTAVLAKKGGPKKRFKFCVDPHSADTIVYFRVIPGHAGGKHINPTLQDNVLLPIDFTTLGTPTTC